MKERADAEAIRVFSDSLRQLLLAPPLGQKSVLAIDPGFRTGCKVVCLDRQGKLLHRDTIYPHIYRRDRLTRPDARWSIFARALRSRPWRRKRHGGQGNGVFPEGP